MTLWTLFITKLLPLTWIKTIVYKHKSWKQSCVWKHAQKSEWQKLFTKRKGGIKKTHQVDGENVVVANLKRQNSAARRSWGGGGLRLVGSGGPGGGWGADQSQRDREGFEWYPAVAEESVVWVYGGFLCFFLSMQPGLKGLIVSCLRFFSAGNTRRPCFCHWEGWGVRGSTKELKSVWTQEGRLHADCALCRGTLEVFCLE